MTNDGGPPPGWYPDPWTPAGLRWWDGRDWTPHAAPAGPAGPPFDPVRSRKAAAIARWALVGQAVAGSIMALVAYPFVRDLVDALSDAFDDPAAEPAFATGGAAGAVNLLSLASLAVLGCLMYWSHRATTDARSLGWTTRHEAGMATACWIIPVVNLWFPYQVVRDLVDDDRRSQVGWWWAAYLANGFLAVVPIAVGFATGSAGAAAVAALVPIACAWAVAILGGSLVVHASERQQARAASAAGATAPTP